MKTSKAVVLVVALVVAAAVVAAGCSKCPWFGKQAAAKPQTTCPVMGNPIDKQVYTDYQGQRIYFCCPKCKAAFQKEPDKYVAKLKEAGVAIEKTPSK